jgi:hypothetical protein
MSNGVSHRVEIAWEAEGSGSFGRSCRAVVEMDFDQVEVDHVPVFTRLRIHDLTFETGRWYYGINILHFADGLAEMHAQTQGSAWLHDWDGEAVLCLTVINRARGRIAIGGQFTQDVFWTEVASEGDFLTPRLFGSHSGIRVEFEGLVTDQSYLPPVIAVLRRFLSDTGISVRSPME